MARTPAPRAPWLIPWLAAWLLMAPLPTQAQGAAAEPAQWPLLNRVMPPVKPSLMITLDDSGSMALRHLPDTDTEISIGRFRVRSPVTSATSTVKFAVDEKGIFAVTAEPGSPDWPQRFLRSPDTNPIYYNPEVRYRPWLRADGTRYPPASATAALVVPGDPQGGTVDLVTTLDAKDARWCAGVPMVCAMTMHPRRYVPGLYYRLRRDADGFLDPRLASSYDEFNVNRPLGPPRGPGRTDCAGLICTQAEEQQNFANWFTYYRARLLLAKAVLGDVLGQLPDQIRVGYGRLGKGPADVDGLGSFGMIESGVRDFSSSRRADFLAWLYGLNATAPTPLREALQEVGRYFSSGDSRGPWGATPGLASTAPHLACRRAYHLLITDGDWNSTHDVPLLSVGNVDGDAPFVAPPAGSWHYSPARPYSDDWADQLADYAMYYWARDLRPDLPDQVRPLPDNEATWQSLSNFIVGLGVIGTLDPQSDLPALTDGSKRWSENKIDDLWHAALNSRGRYFSATDSSALRQALRQSLAAMAPEGRIQGGVGAGAGTGNGFVKYLPTYRASDWSGNLVAVSLDASGRTGTELWRAEAALPAWSDRRLFIWDDGQAGGRAVPFEWGQLSGSLRQAMGPAAGPALVDYIRGSRSLEEDGGWRVRSGLLGDFINSTPLVAVASEDPSLRRLPEIGNSYPAYLQDVKGRRPRVIYLGGNDGMVHAFRDAPGADGSPAGREIFAYLPRAVAGRLEALRGVDYNLRPENHRYFVDGPLRESDVHVRPPGGGAPAWRNYLLGSTGAGPASVFAIDITDPNALDASSPRWEVHGEQEPRLGHVMAPVVTGRLPNGRWVALFGNGYGSPSGRAHLFVVELETGVVRALALPGSGGPDGLGGVALAKDSLGQVSGVYAGDLAGRLWRLDFDAQEPSYFRIAFGGQPLFQAPAGQAVVQAPVMQARGTSRLLMVGTGRLITAADVADATPQAVYLVEDRPNDTLARPLGQQQLARRTLAAAGSGMSGASPALYGVAGDEVDWDSQRGWWLPLSGSGVPTGLRMLQPIQAASARGELVLVAAEAPAESADACTDIVTGSGINLLLPFATGLPTRTPVLDTTADGVVDSRDDRTVLGYATASDGADAVLQVSWSTAGGRLPAQNDGAPSGAGPGTDAGWSCGGQGLLTSVSGTVGACLSVGQALRDRAWRRILNPPF